MLEPYRLVSGSYNSKEDSVIPICVLKYRNKKLDSSRRGDGSKSGPGNRAHLVKGAVCQRLLKAVVSLGKLKKRRIPGTYIRRGNNIVAVVAAQLSSFRGASAGRNRGVRVRSACSCTVSHNQVCIEPKSRVHDNLIRC